MMNEIRNNVHKIENSMPDSRLIRHFEGVLCVTLPRPVFIYKGEIKLKDIPGKDPTFGDCIQSIMNLYKLDNKDLTIGLEINGHAVYVGRIFTNLKKNGMKFVIKRGTKISEIGEFLGFDFSEKVENVNDPSKQVKVLVGLELYYKTETLLDDLKMELSSMVPKWHYSLYRGTVRNKILSGLMGKSANHVDSLYYYIRNSYPGYVLSIENIADYLNNLRQSKQIREFNEKVVPLFNKYIKYNDCPLVSIGAHKLSPNFRDSYFKYINTIQKAYWLGWIYAEGHLELRKQDGQMQFAIACNVQDGELMKRFIWELGINPTKVEYGRQYYIYDEDGNRKIIHKNDYTDDMGELKVSRMFRLQITSKRFTDYLASLGLPIGKKSGIIRFPHLKNRELQLAFLLGFFDGDGHLIIDDSGRAVQARINSKSKDFLEDVKRIFKLKYDVTSGKFTIGGKIYNEMMDLKLRSLERKRHRFDEIYFKSQRKMKFTEKELADLATKYDYHEIAELHRIRFGISITPSNIGYHVRKLKNSKRFPNLL